MEKYTTQSTIDKLDGAEAGKIILSNDAYAITEAVHILIQQLKELGNRIR